MAAKQDHDDDMDDITEELDDGDDIETLLESIETSRKEGMISNLTARRRIEDLLEERRLRHLIEDYNDWD